MLLCIITVHSIYRGQRKCTDFS